MTPLNVEATWCGGQRPDGDCCGGTKLGGFQTYICEVGDTATDK